MRDSPHNLSPGVTTLDWNKLRLWSGSQQSAFEEICCQLAHSEDAPAGAKFIRKATPDAGIECYWSLSTGDEWAWQAKFFLSAPDDGRWSQIDKSIETALEKHPRLTRYTICLPIDRADPRIPDREFFMDKWDSHVAKWQQWAQKRAISVEFEYWGNHEISLVLTKEEHRGRAYFWFTEEILNQSWFRDRLEESVVAAGARYTPDLNVKLPIVQMFEGLARTKAFFDNFAIQRGKIRKLHWYVQSRESNNPELKPRFADLDQSITRVLALLELMKNSPEGSLPLASISGVATEAIDRVKALLRAVHELDRAQENEENKENKAGVPPLDLQSGKRDLEQIRHYGHELLEALHEIGSFSTSSEAMLANLPAMLLVGDAGTGKTHLLCDLAEQMVNNNAPTILVLGEILRDEEPWSQLIKRLGLVCNREEFLGALDTAAEAAGVRALIFIDALNEGGGKTLWHRELPGFLVVLSRFPRLGLAISVRKSYEPIIIPKTLVPNRLVRVEHSGFAGHEYEATRTFFDHYGIQQPTIPLLASEFDNPLFLKLVCRGLQNRALTSIPKGLRGIKKVFDFFLGSVNEKISHPQELNFDPHDRIVQKAAHRLAELMAENRSTWLERSIAANAVNVFYAYQGFDGSLFQRLLDEGVITREGIGLSKDEWHEEVRFAYERLGDHMVIEVLLDRHLDRLALEKSFDPSMPLGKLLADEHTCWMNRGLVEALSVQLPERVNKELGDLAPHVADSRPVLEAFVQSIVWRDPKFIGNATLDYYNQYVRSHPQMYSQFLDALLTVSGDPEHPYNAQFLHNHLMSLDLAERDQVWSIFIHNQYRGRSAVDRLIDWSWSDRPKIHISDTAILLTGIALAWFFTSSNRYLRDRATKALVALLSPRLGVVQKCLRAFRDVNDPYVIERVAAVAYGCAMRSSDMRGLGDLARDTYEWFFSKGAPPPNLLLRDYARGIVECALHRGIQLDVDEKFITPPYHSEWSDAVMSQEILKERYKASTEKRSPQEFALSSIYWSVMEGDFGHYVVGTNSGVFHWSSRRLGEPSEPTRSEKYNSFVSMLGPKQKKNLIAFQEALSATRQFKFDQKTNEAGLVYPMGASETFRLTKQKLTKSLGKKKNELFLSDALPSLENPIENRDIHAFDLNLVQRWILQKILDLGWTVERFGNFDRYTASSWDGSDTQRKTERIGKKYQWIAYHELLARVSDNFQFRDTPWSDTPGKYEGPWRFHGRDIDPSMILPKLGKCSSSGWWTAKAYDRWLPECEDESWLQKYDDLPDPKQLIDLSRPLDGVKWLCLDGTHTWEEPSPLDEDRFEKPRRLLWLHLRCYVVNKKDSDAVFSWSAKQDFWGRWMPDSSEPRDVFLGEYFWAPAFMSQKGEYFGRPGWAETTNPRLPYALLDAVDRYSWSANGYDCSLEDSINIILPCDWIANGMGLEWNGRAGHFHDSKGRLVTFDPSVENAGPRALLLIRADLLHFLEQQHCDLLWTVTGAKQMLGGGPARGRWKGELQISGSYRLKGNDLEGSLRTKFRSRSNP